jgi:hypothetical protein
MSSPSSSLSRLVVLFERVTTHDNNAPMILRWAEALRIVPENAGLGQTTARTALRAMALMNEEFERARLSLAATPFPTSDYEAAFNRAQKTIDFQQLNTAWSSLRGELSSETLGVLRLCSRVVAAEEQLLDEGELEDVDAAIADLVSVLANLPATDALARVLAEQLEIMRQARVDYQIGGASVLRRAVYGLDGAVVNQMSQERSTDKGDSHERAAVVRSAYRLSRAVKVALATAGVVAALGGAVEGALHIAEASATAQMFYLTSGPSLDAHSAP